MRFNLSHDAFPLAQIQLTNGESVQIQTGSMIYHDEAVQLSAGLNSGKSGGLLGAIGRSITSGESIFMTQAQGTGNGGTLAIAPNLPGTIAQLEVGSQHWFLNDGVFLAMDSSVTYQMHRQKATGAIFGGTGGFFIMETAGQGDLLVNAYGSLKTIELDGTRPLTIDNSHVVAWETSLDYQIHLETGGFFGSIGTGEGLVNTFSGRGKVLIQTLNLETFAKRLTPFLPSRSN